MVTICTARLLLDGDDQIILIPDEFRLPGSEVSLKKLECGVLIEPIEVNESSAPEDPPANNSSACF